MADAWDAYPDAPVANGGGDDPWSAFPDAPKQSAEDQASVAALERQRTNQSALPSLGVDPSSLERSFYENIIKEPAKQIYAGLTEGVVGLPGMPGAMADLAGRGIDWAAERALSPERLEAYKKANEGRENPLPMPETFIKPYEKYVSGPLPEVRRNPDGSPVLSDQYIRTTASFAPFVIGGPGSLATRAITRAAAPAAGALAGEKAAEGTGYEEVSGLAGMILAGHAAGRAHTGITQRLEQERAQRADKAKAAVQPEKLPPAENAAQITEEQINAAPQTTPEPVPPFGFGREGISPDVKLLSPEVSHTAPISELHDSVGAARAEDILSQTSDETKEFLGNELRDHFNEHTLEDKIEGLSPHESTAELNSNFQKLTSGLATHPGRSNVELTNFFDQRQLAEGPERRKVALDEAFGHTVNQAQWKRELSTAQRNRSAPFWKVFDKTEIPPTEKLTEILARPDMKSAIAQGIRAMKNRGEPVVNRFDDELGKEVTVPTARVIQRAKVALDDRINNLLTREGKKNQAVDLIQLKNELLKAIDNHPDPNVSGLWREARETWAPEEELKSAYKLGESLLSSKVHKTEVPYLMEGLSKPEKRAVTQGMREHFDEISGRKGSRTTLNEINEALSKANREKIAGVIGEESADKLFKAFEAEHRMHFSRNEILKGSQTGERQLYRAKWEPAKAEAIPGVSFSLRDVGHAVRHPFRVATGKALEATNAALERRSAKETAAQKETFKKIREESARLLTLQGPERDAVLRSLLHDNGQAPPQAVPRRGPAPMVPPRQSAPSPTGDEYVNQAMANLRATSRTAAGTLDLSSTPGKEEKMVAGLTPQAAAQAAQENFGRLIRELYDAKDNLPTDGRGMAAFIDEVAGRVNEGIVKPGELERTADTKFPNQTAANDLWLAHQQFSDELAARLADPAADPIETAAWIEWRANLIDHFWSDGVGKSSKALAALPLMRAGLPLPTYPPNKKLFGFTKGVSRVDPREGGQAYLGDAWDKFNTYYHDMVHPRESLEAAIKAEAHPDELAQHPMVLNAIAANEARVPTGSPEQFADPDWRASRVYDFKGEQIHGWDDAVERLTDGARAFSTDGPVANDRHAIIVLGPPAAGKSSISEPLARRYHAALVDPDEAKKVIPEYENGVGTSAVHEESSELSKDVLFNLVVDGSNLVLPKVGHSLDSIRRQVEKLKRAGYTVDIAHVAANPEVSGRRNIKRFLDTGRLVDPDFIKEVGDNPRSNSHILKGEANDFLDADTSGRHPRIIEGTGRLANEIRAEVANRGRDGQDVGLGNGAGPRRGPEETGQVAESSSFAQAEGLIGAEPSNLRPHRVSTADGTAIDVAPVVVEASQLRTSQDPGYDKSLQPRQRSRAASQAQVRDIASNLDPERLGYSAEADRGAPIVGPDSMVESGNGRVLALRNVYEQGGDKAKEYRDWLGRQGVDVSAYRNPVLVRQRITPMSPKERQAFTAAANQASTLAMSATERARADAKLIDNKTLNLLTNPHDIGANRDFVRRFVRELPQAEQGALMDAHGALSAEGVTRIRNALFAKAYDDVGVLSRLAESTDDEVRSISNALAVSAPQWAKLRADVKAGNVRPDMDLTPDLMEAVKRTAKIRGEGQKLETYLAQSDAFNKIPDTVEGFMRMFYDPQGRKALGGKRINDALAFYADEARKVTSEPGLDLGLVPVEARDIQKIAREKGWEGYGEEISNRGGPGDGEGGPKDGGQIRRQGVGEGGQGSETAGGAGRNAQIFRAVGREAPLELRPEEPDAGKLISVANKVANEWQNKLGPDIKVVMGGSLVSRTYVHAGHAPIDMDIRFLTKNPERDYPKIEAVTGLKLRKTRPVDDYPSGSSKAFLVEGPLTRDGIVFDAEAAVRTPAYVGWARFYPKVMTPDEMSAFRADKARLKGDKEEYKALKGRMLTEVRRRVEELGGPEQVEKQVAGGGQPLRREVEARTPQGRPLRTEPLRGIGKEQSIIEAAYSTPPKTLYHVAGRGYKEGQPIQSMYRRFGDAAYGKFDKKWPESGGLSQDHAHKNFLYDNLADAKNHQLDFGGKVYKVDSSQVDGLAREQLEGKGRFWSTTKDIPSSALSKPTSVEQPPLMQAKKRTVAGQEDLFGGTNVLGDGLRESASQVPGGRQPGNAGPTTPVRKPEQLSLFGGPGGGGEVSKPHAPVQQQPGGPETPAPGAGESVTKPPDGGGRVGEGGTDKPTPPRIQGRRDAELKIAERSRSNYRITDSDLVGEGGAKQKVRGNIEAIKVLKQIEDEGRDATPEEKAKLVKYTGWGAHAQDMFKGDYRRQWESERAELKAILSDEEYASARASTPNAHYTSPDVVRGMWDAMDHLGYEGGSTIEPSAGIGHFIGLIPDKWAPKTAWTAVELDSITGQIAKKLYGGAEVNVHGFEDLKRPANHYDLAISNVPFGNYPVKEKPYGEHSIHNFFFIKALDKVRPGGIVSFITSSHTMDAPTHGNVRRLLANTSDLVGAIRLPGGSKGAFASNAGTQVTTDIIFLRKKVPGEAPFPGASWSGPLKEVQTPEGPTKINEYYVENPHMMLGEMRLKGTQYRADEPILIGDPEGMQHKIAEASKNMPAGAMMVRDTPPPPPIHSNEIGAGIKDGAFFVKDGKLYQRREGQGHEHELPPLDASRVKKLIGIRDTYNDLMRAQIDGVGDKEALRTDLRKKYDNFVDLYGPINKEEKTVTKRLNKAGENIVLTKYPNFKEFRNDPDSYKVASIEHYDSETGKAKPADIQNKDVIRPQMERQINGPSDALSASLNDKGAVDLDHIAQSLGVDSHDAAISALGDTVFQNPDGRAWETAAKYLSGNVIKKLEDARSLAETDPSYLRNVSALEKVQPTPLVGAEITAQFGAPWVPEAVYENFLKEIGGGGIKVVKVPITGDWRVKASHFDADARAKYGTPDVGVDEIAESAMNGRPVTVRDPPDRDGNRAINPKKTEDARVKTELLKEAFTGDPEMGVEGWVWQDPERSQLLEGIYNRLHNDLVGQQFDGSHLTLPGLNPDFAGRKHRLDAVWRIIQNGNTLLAHVVGSGKTITSIAAGMEQKRLGLINKPMYVVPGHMLEQFSREFIQGYPNAKILVASKEEMSPDNRKAFLAKAASNDWDGIVITRDSFGRINMRSEFQQKFIRDQLDELARVMQAEEKEGGKGSQTIKALEKAKKRLRGKLDDLLNEEKKDEGTSFEESGVDFLFVDEAHCFPHDTLVATDRGPLKIGDIVEGRLPVSVASYDHNSRQIVWNPIHNYWRHNRGSKQFALVRTDKSDIIATTNHQVFVEGKGYVDVETIVSGENLCFLPASISSDRLAPEMLLSAMQRQSCELEDVREELRTVRPVIPISQFREDKQRQKTFLWNLLCGNMAYGSTGEDREVYSQDAHCRGKKVGRPCIQGCESVGSIEKDACQQSNVDARGSGESRQGSIWTNISGARRQWETDKTTVNVARIDQTPDGVRNLDKIGLGKVPKSTEPLQGRFGRSNPNVGNRGGWQKSPFTKMEISRQTQDGNIECARVVSVEVLERGSDREPRTGGPEDQFVYDLGIAGEHNYFANGILVHNSFKNLDFITRFQRVKGMAQNPSQRATDLFLKIRYLEQNRPGRSAVFMTGTPISNTMAEMWTVQRYLQYDKLKERGLDTFDAWANTFGKVATNTELAQDGRTFKDVSSFSRFVNIPELISLYSEVADTKTADMLKLPRPESKTHIVKAELSSAEENFIQGIINATEALKGKPPEKGKPAVVSLGTAGRKVAIDGRLVGNTASDQMAMEMSPNPGKKEDFDFNPRGKTAKAVGNIHKIWAEGKEPGTVQMVFLDMGMPKTARKGKAKSSDEGPPQEDDSAFSVYDDLKQRLVDKGIPAHEIAFIHDATDDIKKAKLFHKVRNGDIRVLVGSTEKMGVGTNVQDRLIAMHHLDAPWKPAEVEQRDGRIVRQGNKNPNVDIYRYVTEKSFDAFMWQTLERKAAFLNQVLSGAKGSRWAEDIDNPLPDAAQMKAAASGDVRILEHAELDRQVRMLTSQKRVYDQTKSRAFGESNAAKSKIEQYEAALPKAHEDAGRVTDIAGKNFSVDLGDKTVTERKSAGQEILDKLRKIGNEKFYTPKVVNVGRMSDFDMNIELRYAWDGEATSLRATPSLKGNSGYSAANDTVINEHTDPAGLMRRFENILGNVKDRPGQLENELKNERKSVERLEKTMNESWPKEKEYQAALKKLQDLTEAIKAPKHPDVHSAEMREKVSEQEAPPIKELRGARLYAEPQQRASGGSVDVKPPFSTRKESNYSPSRGKPNHHCGICSMFLKPHSCSAVFGYIVPQGGCDWFKPKTPDRASGGRVMAHYIDNSPTEAQKDAGNYRKAHINVNGLDISIENAKGSERSGVGGDGKRWKTLMSAAYGYIKKTVGADSDHVDCYVGPHRASRKVFIIDQRNSETGKFDEHKCLLSFGSAEQAKNVYLKGFSDGKGKARLGHMTEMDIDAFKKWLAEGDTTKPVKGSDHDIPRIDRTRDVRVMSELSRDGSVMFIDRSLPSRILLKGKPIDPAQPLLRHEMAEYKAMKEAEAEFVKRQGRKPNDAERKQIYTHAHKRHGTVAEQKYLRDNNFDVISWNAWANGELARLEKKKAPNPPPRTDVKVFPHGRGELEYAG